MNATFQLSQEGVKDVTVYTRINFLNNSDFAISVKCFANAYLMEPNTGAQSSNVGYLSMSSNQTIQNRQSHTEQMGPTSLIPEESMGLVVDFDTLVAKFTTTILKTLKATVRAWVTIGNTQYDLLTQDLAIDKHVIIYLVGSSLSNTFTVDNGTVIEIQVEFISV